MPAADLIRGVFSQASPGSVAGVSITLTAPAGTVAGDQFIFLISERDVVTTWTPPAGMILHESIIDSGEGRFYRAKYGTDITGTSWTFTSGSDTTTDKWAVAGLVLKGDQVGDFLIGDATDRAGAQTTGPTPSIVTTEDAILVALVGDRVSGGSSWTWPSGWTEQADINNGEAGTNEVSASCAVYETIPAPAGTYQVTPTATLSTGTGWSGIFAFAVTGGGSTPPPSGPMSTPDLLARSGTVVPAALHTLSYDIVSPPADTTYDARGSRFEGYFDYDATYEEGVFAGGSTDHQKNSKPIRLGVTTPTTNGALIGGVTVGTQPDNLTWNRHKHGSVVQQKLDEGMDPEVVWDTYATKNIDGDSRVYVAEGSWFIKDGHRAYNVHDGFGIYGATESRSDTGHVYIRNDWVWWGHDDAIENDNSQLSLTVEDSLYEEVFSFISTRCPDESGTSDASKPQTVRNSIISLRPHPGPHKSMSSETGSGYWYKHQTNSPPLVMENCVLAVTKAHSSTGYTLPTFTGCSYANVTIVWRGAGAYPGNVPAGVTVTTDLTVLTDAIAEWKGRHGVTDFETVDMAKMISPDATWTPPEEPPPPAADGPLPGVIDGVEPEAQGYVPPLCDGNGNLYRVTEERLAQGNNPMMMKSSDGGSTWAQADAAGAPEGSSLNDLESGWCFQDTVNKLIGFLWTDDTFLYYTTFRTSDHPTSPDTWGLIEIAFSDLNGGSRAQASVAQLSDGRVRSVFTNAQSLGQLALATKSTTTGAGGWSAKTSLAGGSDNFLGGSIVVGEADKLHIFTHNDAAQTVLHRTYSSADVLSANVRVDTAGTETSSANFHAVSNPVYYDVAGAEVISVLYAAAGGGVRLIQIIDGVASDTAITGSSVAIAPAGTEGSTGADNAHFSLAVDGTTLHAIWADNASGDLMRSERPHGGSWTTPAVLWDSGANFCYWCYANVFVRNGATILGYTYDVGPHSDDGTQIRYNALVLSAGSTPTGRGRYVWDGSGLTLRKIQRWNGSALVTAAIKG